MRSELRTTRIRRNCVESKLMRIRNELPEKDSRNLAVAHMRETGRPAYLLNRFELHRGPIFFRVLFF